MIRKTAALMIVMLLLLPGLAGAVSEKDFVAETTRDLIGLCSASPDDPLYHQAINFCHGYLFRADHRAYGLRAGLTVNDDSASAPSVFAFSIAFSSSIS